METNNSDVSASFGFGKPNTDNVKQKVENTISPVEETPVVKEVVNTPDDEDESYTDERSVTIALVKNYSLYRRANDKVLPKRRDYIGGSVTASRVLSANKDEIETYFPNIVGLAPNNENFITRVRPSYFVLSEKTFISGIVTVFTDP